MYRYRTERIRREASQTVRRIIQERYDGYVSVFGFNLNTPADDRIVDSAQLDGTTTLGKNSKIIRCTLMGDVEIGDNVFIADSVLTGRKIVIGSGSIVIGTKITGSVTFGHGALIYDSYMYAQAAPGVQVTIGNDLCLTRSNLLLQGKHVSIGDRATIGPKMHVILRGRRNVSVGDRVLMIPRDDAEAMDYVDMVSMRRDVTIGDDLVLKGQAVMRTTRDMIIGHRCGIFSVGTMYLVEGSLKMGTESMIASPRETRVWAPGYRSARTLRVRSMRILELGYRSLLIQARSSAYETSTGYVRVPDGQKSIETWRQ